LGEGAGGPRQVFVRSAVSQCVRFVASVAVLVLLAGPPGVVVAIIALVAAAVLPKR
jgi:hypothetical protein